jgi:hypothetical protein
MTITNFRNFLDEKPSDFDDENITGTIMQQRLSAGGGRENSETRHEIEKAKAARCRGY